MEEGEEEVGDEGGSGSRRLSEKIDEASGGCLLPLMLASRAVLRPSVSPGKEERPEEEKEGVLLFLEESGAFTGESPRAEEELLVALFPWKEALDWEGGRLKSLPKRSESA